MQSDVKFETKKIKSQAQVSFFFWGGLATQNSPSGEAGNFGQGIFALGFCDLNFFTHVLPFFRLNFRKFFRATPRQKISETLSHDSSPNCLAASLRRNYSPQVFAASLHRNSSPQVFIASFCLDVPVLCDMFTNMYSNIHV